MAGKFVPRHIHRAFSGLTPLHIGCYMKPGWHTANEWESFPGANPAGKRRQRHTSATSCENAWVTITTFHSTMSCTVYRRASRFLCGYLCHDDFFPCQERMSESNATCCRTTNNRVYPCTVGIPWRLRVLLMEPERDDTGTGTAGQVRRCHGNALLDVEAPVFPGVPGTGKWCYFV